MTGPRRSYSSAATEDDAVSTEGITFDLDNVAFTCHGRISAIDLSEFAGPAADAGDNDLDPHLVRILADMMRMVFGEETYREITRHRRKHQTPDGLMQTILMDVVEEAAQRPTSRPSPSPGGRPEPRPSLAGSPSPDGPEWEPWTPPARPVAPRQGRGDRALTALAGLGDVTFAPAPGAAAPPNPAAGKRPARVRRLSLAHPEQGVQVQEAEDTGTG